MTELFSSIRPICECGVFAMIVLAEASAVQVQTVTCRHELNINPLLLCLSSSQQKVLQSLQVNHLVKVCFGLRIIPTLSDLLF